MHILPSPHYRFLFKILNLLSIDLLTICPFEEMFPINDFFLILNREHDIFLLRKQIINIVYERVTQMAFAEQLTTTSLQM